MSLAAKYYERDWPTVEDVSATCSFDLLCRREPETLRVEVKGTTTDGRSVILTKNEVEAAREPGYALFVVSDIEIARGENPKVYGGRCRVFEPWHIDPGALTPLQYRCALKVETGKEVQL